LEIASEKCVWEGYQLQVHIATYSFVLIDARNKNKTKISVFWFDSSCCDKHHGQKQFGRGMDLL
jgi:hypothetical protein